MSDCFRQIDDRGRQYHYYFRAQRSNADCWLARSGALFPCLSIAEARTERALDVQDLRRPGARTRSGAPSSDPASYDEGILVGCGLLPRIGNLSGHIIITKS